MSTEGRNEEIRERRYSAIGPTGRMVARNLYRLRTDRGLSLRQLSVMMKDEKVGRNLGPDALNKAENGQRRLDIDDVVALAAVLGVNVNALLLPVEVDRERPVEVTGAPEPVRAERAWRWLNGEAPLPGRGAREKEFHSAVNPWWILARHVT